MQENRRFYKTLVRGVQGTTQFALDRLLPPRCYSCGTGLSAQGGLCPQCWQSLNFITDPQCARCGLPFDYEVARASLCGACLSKTPAYDVARAAMRYDDASRPFILAFKHGDETRHMRPFAQWMARSARDIVQEDMILIPVPLHKSRLFRRRYNQAALLARSLSQILNLPCDMGVLKRIKATQSQGGLNAHARHDNVKRAFAVPAAKAAKIQNRPVMLIDDVLTTGATVSACARALRKNGATSVAVITLARVVRPVNPTI